MKGDLAWLPLYVDDFLGGTLSMPQAMLGAYLLALLAQWKSGEIQAIKDDKKSLQIICRGKMDSEVREKFVSVEIDGQRYLRNERLAVVYREQAQIHTKRVETARAGAAARWKHAESNAPSMLEGIASQIPDPKEGIHVESNNQNISLPPAPRERKVETKIPADFSLTDAMSSWAAEKLTVRLDLQRETDKFRDHALSHDRRCKDWVAAWRNWLRTAAERAAPVQAPQTYEEGLTARGYGRNTFPGPP